MSDESIALIKKILNDRSEYWHREHHEGVSMAYDTALNLLELALDDNIECLRQFDYYGKEE